ELFLALVKTRADQLLHGMPERVEAALAMPDAREGLARILAVQLAASRSDPDFARLFLEFIVESRDTQVRDAVAGVYRQTHDISAELTENLKHQGRVSEKLEPHAFAILWSAILDGLALLSLVDPDRVDPEVLAPQIVELIWNGMKRRYGGL